MEPVDVDNLVHSSSTPGEFWSRLAQMLAGSWGLSSLFVIQRTQKEIRLLGKSDSARIENVPQEVHRAVAQGPVDKSARTSLGDGVWVTMPIRIPGTEGGCLLGLTDQESESDESRMVLAAEMAVSAFQATAHAKKQAVSEYLTRTRLNIHGSSCWSLRRNFIGTIIRLPNLQSV